MFRAAAIAVLLLAAPAAAQQADRRSREEPEVVVEAGGRVGTCDAILFDKAGKHLFAAGDDKVVRVWPVTDKGLDTEPGHGRVLRWRAWREQRGGIKALAVSPDGARVAVGGYGMRPSTVAVIDRDTGDLVGLTWAKSRPGIDNFNAVTAVAFSADGARVGFGTADGSLWVWTPSLLKEHPETAPPSPWPLWAGRHEKRKLPDGAVAEFNIPRAIRFTDGTTLESVAQSGEVRAAKLGALGDTADGPSESKGLFFANDPAPRFPVRRAAWSADGRWLAAAVDGPTVCIVSADGKQPFRRDLPEGRFPRSVAWDAKTGRLAVGVAEALPAAEGKPRFYAEGRDDIHLYDAPPAGEAKAAVLPYTGPAEAIAFHPDGRLAIAGGDADEVTLTPVGGPAFVLRGAGRRNWAVNLSADGKVLGVQTARTPRATDPNARGAGDWTKFDLDRLAPTRGDANWVGVVSSADGWRIEPDTADRFLWHAVLSRPGVPDVKHPLTLDWNRDQASTCFTFLPARNGKPTQVIVGHYYGASLFELRAEGATRARLFTGHAGEVLSVVAAADGSWFVTGGADHTVAAWQLNEGSTLGAAVAVRDGVPVVTSVSIGSPGWEAGLRVGDRLDLLAVGGQLVFDRRPGTKAVGTADDAVKALANPVSGVELFFGLAQPEQPRRDTLTSVRQRPVWKWFAGYHEGGRLTEWVAWSWHGSYYHTASAHGDRLVGWHVNAPGAGTRPEFYPLQQFEKQFHRPDVIEKLLGGRDLAGALTLAQDGNPLPRSFTKYEPAPVRVGVKETEAGPNGVTASVVVRRRGSNVDLMPERVELWLNDHRYKTWSAGGKDVIDETVTVPRAALRSGENRLAVVTFNAAGGRAEDSRLVRNPAPAAPPNLVAVSVGINDYSANRKAAGGARKLDDLSFATKDATDIRDTFKTYAGGCFQTATIDLRLDAKATRSQLLAALDAAAKGAKPDDLLVVFFAGHGDLLGADANAKVVSKRARGVLTGAGRFLLCGPDYAPATAEKTGLSAEELFAALAKVNCRQMVLLDACHSGEAAAANVVRRCVPDGQGPFVVCSCDQGQLSYESPRVGGGVFTRAIVDALGPGYGRADADTDGTIGGDELVEYVAGRLPALLRAAGQRDDAQQPITFPHRPPTRAVVSR